MSDRGVFLRYKGDEIVQLENDGELTLLTKNSFLEDDIEVEVKRAETLVSKTVTQNGEYDPADDEADGYSDVTVNVPNTYEAGDEGKVVSNGELVSQTSVTKTANGTYDTTLNNEVVVNVSGGGGASVGDIVDILNEGVLNSLVPFYTSATNPTGYTLSYSSQNGSSTPAWAVFNNTIAPVTNSTISNVRWTASQALPQWVQIQLPEAKKINAFYIANNKPANASPDFSCKTYKIQGSNDGTTFTDIYTETIANEAIGKYVALPQESDAYLYYRFVVTESYHSSYSGITSFFPIFIGL